MYKYTYTCNGINMIKRMENQTKEEKAKQTKMYKKDDRDIVRRR